MAGENHAKERSSSNSQMVCTIVIDLESETAAKHVIYNTQGCHNLLTINPTEHTPNPEIIMENTVPYGNKRLK